MKWWPEPEWYTSVLYYGRKRSISENWLMQTQTMQALHHINDGKEARVYEYRKYLVNISQKYLENIIQKYFILMMEKRRIWIRKLICFCKNFVKITVFVKFISVMILYLTLVEVLFSNLLWFMYIWNTDSKYIYQCCIELADAGPWWT